MKRKLAMLLCLCVLMLPILTLAEESDWAEDLECATIGNCRESVNVREGAGKDFNVIGTAILGEEIKLLQWSGDESWCFVLYNDESNVGWVHRDYIVLQE